MYSTNTPIQTSYAPLTLLRAIQRAYNLIQFEALRRVHLIPSGDAPEESEEGNVNVFRNLDSPVSESGDNFSTGFVVHLPPSESLLTTVTQGEATIVHGACDIETFKSSSYG